MRPKIQRILKFKQFQWLKKEKNGGNDFERDSFKSTNNSAYRKTMENLNKKVDLRHAANAKDYQKFVSKSSFVSQKLSNFNCSSQNQRSIDA